MTSLAAEAASFFSHSLGRVKGQSSPQDVACGVLISVGSVATRLAHERRLGDAIISPCVPAGFTAVGGVPGVHFEQAAPSVLRFGAQYRK